MIAGYDVFIEYAEAIRHSLSELGYDKEKIFIEDSTGDLNRSDQSFCMTFVFISLKNWKPWHIHGHAILVQTEELWNRRAQGAYFSSGGGNMGDGFTRVLEMYDENCKIPIGTKNVVYCPVGYSPIWERDLPDVPEDIDICFHGSITDRRKKFRKEFEKMGLNVVFTQTAYGAKRDKLIARSKIDINIKAHDNWSYGPLHCLPAQANKKFMLAEKANGGYGPFKSGIHVAAYNGLGDCVKKVRYWLDHEKERKEFAIKAYDDMVKTCNFTKIFAEAMRGLY